MFIYSVTKVVKNYCQHFSSKALESILTILKEYRKVKVFSIFFTKFIGISFSIHKIVIKKIVLLVLKTPVFIFFCWNTAIWKIVRYDTIITLNFTLSFYIYSTLFILFLPHSSFKKGFLCFLKCFKVKTSNAGLKMYAIFVER